MNVLGMLALGTHVLGRSAAENLPVIKTIASVLGTVATPILACKGTLKAKEILDAEQAKRGPDAVISTGEKIELTWPHFIVPILVCGATVFIEIENTKDLLGKLTTTTAIAAASNKALEEYRNKNKELFGEAKDQKIESALAKQKISEFKANGISFPEVHSADEHVFHDKFSGRLFVSTISKLREAVANINLALIPGGTWSSENQMQLNDLYNEINDPVHLGVLASGYNVGWSTNNSLKYDIHWEEYDGSKIVGFVSYNLYDLATNTPMMSV